MLLLVKHLAPLPMMVQTSLDEQFYLLITYRMKYLMHAHDMYIVTTTMATWDSNHTMHTILVHFRPFETHPEKY